MTNDVKDTLSQLVDFQSALASGFGLSKSEEDTNAQKFFEQLNAKVFTDSGLQQVAENLIASMSRLRSLSEMPLDLFDYGRRFQHFVKDLPYREFFSPTPNEELNALLRQQFVEAEEKVVKWITGQEAFPHQPFVTNFFNVAGYATVPEVTSPELAESTARRKKDQIKSFCESLIIQWWSHFETCSEDLWEAAVNSHPAILGDIGSKVRFSFNDLQRFKFKLDTTLGSALIASREVSFRSLEGIRDAYKKSFSQQGGNINATLDNKELDYAAAIRNLLVHKQGVVDKEFIRQMKQAPNFPNLQEGEHFHITGKICAELCDSCFLSSVRLVNDVHTWIVGHQK